MGNVNTSNMEQKFSTLEVAKAVGISKMTLLRWLYAGEIAEPAYKIRIGNIDNRLWSQSELDAVRLYKEANYRKRS